MPRKRRVEKIQKTTVNSIPDHVVAWFSGQARADMYVFIPQHHDDLRMYWQAWGKVHRNCSPPKDEIDPKQEQRERSYHGQHWNNQFWAGQLGLLRGGKLRDVPHPLKPGPLKPGTFEPIGFVDDDE